MTRGITISALGCLLVAGAACASILDHNSIPDAGSEQAVASISERVVTNRQAKADKLNVVRLAMASLEPPQQRPAAPLQSAQHPQDQHSQDQHSSEPLQQAYASAEPNDAIDAPREVTASAPAVSEPAPRPKLVEKPAQPKAEALLSDAQIAHIKERLKLSPDQEYYWPSVESALHAIGHRIQANRRADPHAAGVPIDPDSPEVQELKSAAMPLLFGLREDQKREVRSLARQIGLEKVAEMI